MMIHTKLSMRRLAYVPWLLAAGLVLGWSEKAVAASSSTAGHSTATNHPHATNPNLVLTYDLLSSGSNHSIAVRWSTSRSTNFSTGNGAAATTYAVNLYSGEIDSDLASPSDTEVGSGQSFTGGTVNTRTHSFTDAAIKYEGEEEGATGKYWVRIAVTVTSTDQGHTSHVEYFAKQITVLADYILSVNPNSVREDANRTNVTVKVRVGNDVAVGRNTNVNLEHSIPAGKLGLNDRFYITIPTLIIAKGKKEATGTIVLTPISEDTQNEDLPITISGRATAQEAVKPTTITLVDTDKQSDAINLSFSDADLSKRDGTANIVVTATLNGKKQRKDLSFSLVIDETRSEASGLERDVDYTAIMARITIPDRKVSGRATISIRPKNAGTGMIWIGAPSTANLTNDDDNPITVNANSIEITGEPAELITGLTATPFSIREDSGPRVITLKVSLENALLATEQVQFTITDDSDNLGEAFESAVDAERDVDYAAEVQALTIPKGQKEGTTTMIVTPVNNRDDDPPRAFKVNARVGTNESFVTGILITDDDTTSDSITLEVRPDEINEDAGATEVTVTGTLNGKVFGDNVVVALVIDNDVNGDGEIDDDDNAATRDADYIAILRPLVIPARAVSGTTTITVTPTANDGEEEDEKFRIATLASKPPRAEDEDGDLQELEVTPATITLKDVKDSSTPTSRPDPKIPAFAVADSIANQEYEAGTAIAPLVLPEATGGDGTLTYSVSTLPAGLTFNGSTRTLSGTPIVAGTSTIVYTVIDRDSDAAALTFSIAVNAAQTAPEPETPPPATNVALTASPSSIREDAAATQVFLTVTLPAAKATAERVTFTLVGPSGGAPAVRDLDYTATLGTLITIPAGATIGTTAFSLTPIDNARVDGVRALGVQAAFSSGGVLVTNIEIADDEAPSTSISLSADPRTISEEGDEVAVMVTATLDGKALLANATVRLTIDGTSTATRDEDYAALFSPLLVIPAGSITGSTLFAVRPIDDTVAEGNETIKLTGAIAGLTGDEVVIILSDRGTEKPPQEPEPEEPGVPSLGFAAGVSIADQEYTAGTAITALVLPAAVGGTGTLTYSASALPAGLSFDAATRTITGTPSEETDGAVRIIYTVIDGDGAAAALTFSITVNPPLGLLSLFDLFNSMAAGKVIPTASPNVAEIREFVVGQPVEGLALPAGTGGTAPLTYRLSPALPAGLSFDAATRTIAGTPQAAGEPVYTYTVTDANGASVSLALQTRPVAFALANNFPNPFNPATTIQYALPQAADVKLIVYNVVGQPVRTLVAEHQSAGRYVVEWDATDDGGHSLSAGMYFYRLQAGGEFRAVKKMLLLK